LGGGTPVVLIRDGRKFTVTGDTTVRAGTEIRAESEAPSLNIGVRELDSGSWVIFELPGYSTAATGTAQTSMDALRSATSTSYYKREGTLWVKLVSSGGSPRPGRGGGAADSIQVSR
jgi:cell migration-inducing and hyaluronan-binding protein